MNITINKENTFILLDLDGTLLDTDYMHYEGYRDALKEYSINLLWDDFEESINIGTIESLINSFRLKKEYKSIKETKLQNMLKYKDIKFIDGAEDFLNKLIDNSCNFVIVTNTSKTLVEHFKKCLPFLNKITNWITREDYSEPKPNNESYKLAISRFYNNEKYIIGFENTINGYNAIKTVTNKNYFMANNITFRYNYIINTDINTHLIDNYKSLNNFIT